MRLNGRLAMHVPCAAMMLHAKLSRQCTCMQCTACCARLPATLVLTCLHILPPALWASKTICPTRQNQNPSLKHRTRCGHVFLLSVSLLGLRRGHKVSVLLANTPAQGGADTHGCCCFAHAAAETMHAADTAPVLPHFKLATFSPPAGKPRPNEH